MRRTQSASLHPSSQVGSSSSANLETITLDDEGKKRIADGMWEYLPAIPDLAVNTHIKIWSFSDLPSTLTSIASRGAPLEGYETYPGRALEGYRQDLSITSIDNIMDGNFHRVILGAVPSNDQSERWDIILYDNNEIVMVCENVEVETDKNMEVFVGSYSPDARLTIRRIILIQDE